MVSKAIDPLIVIVGETASGKSKLAVELAARFNGEIINADSWSVYRGFDIGTAKPSPKDRSLITHHLIDIAGPKQGFNAAKYKRLATQTILDINSRGKIPFLVGGTGLYIDSVIYNYSFLPRSNSKLRVKYNAMSLEDLVNETRRLKYETSGIDLNNKRRVIRLLENKGLRPSQSRLRPNTQIIGVKTNIEDLKNNMAKRVDSMLENGLIGEVENLSNIYAWDIEPMKGIGYREFRNYFDGSAEIDSIRSAIIKDSLDLAKKQRTWFKRNKSIQWVTNSDESIDIITTFLNNLSGK